MVAATVFSDKIFYSFSNYLAELFRNINFKRKSIIIKSITFQQFIFQIHMTNPDSNHELLIQDVLYQNNYYFSESEFDHKYYDSRLQNEQHFQYTPEMLISAKKNKFINYQNELNSPDTHYLQKNILNHSPYNVMSLASNHLQQHFDDHQFYIMFKQENLFPNSRPHFNISQMKRLNTVSAISAKLDFNDWGNSNQKQIKNDISNQSNLTKQISEEKISLKDTNPQSKSNQINAKYQQEDATTPTSNKRNSKGLRNLSETVRQIVEQAKITTYKQVAEKLISKLEAQNKINPNSKDEQNVKRRVYDALNVLISANILKKQGKYVMTESNQNSKRFCRKQVYQEQILKLQEKIRLAKLNLNSKFDRMLILQNKFHTISNLISRNKELIKIKQNPKNRKINFPFIGVLYKQETLDKNILIAKNSVQLNFTESFRLIGDIDALLKLSVKAKNFKSKLPKQILEYTCDILEEKQEEKKQILIKK